MIHATVDDMKRFRAANPNARPAASANGSTYKMTSCLPWRNRWLGVAKRPEIEPGPVGLATQWNNNDPSGEAAILENSDYSAASAAASGSKWHPVIARGCHRHRALRHFRHAPPAARPDFAGNWAEPNEPLSPSKPRQYELAAEAVRAGAQLRATPPLHSNPLRPGM